MVALAKISAAFGFGFKHLSSGEQFSAILALLLYRLLQQEKKACVQTIFCLSCEAEARHMYCFSGVVVGVNLFCIYVIFSNIVRVRAMKLGSCIHLEG